VLSPRLRAVLSGRGARDGGALDESDEARRAAKQGTVPERRAYVAARREAARDRDEARVRLAESLARRSRVRIPPEQGFAVCPPGGIGLAADVVEATNSVIDSIGHEQLVSSTNKGGFIAMGFLPEGSLTLDSPYLRFALGEEVVAPIAAYFGLVPVLYEIDTWYSLHGSGALRSSQQWHLDPTDTTTIKVWVHCSDVGPDSGPLTVLPAAASDDLADRIGYGLDSARYRVPDGVFDDLEDGLVPLEGPTGTVDFVDTCRCFHMGSRVEPGGPPRRMAVFHYATPYAFNIADHRSEARFRGLASAGSSELERLVLGAA
jgi:hypothetical protein